MIISQLTNGHNSSPATRGLEFWPGGGKTESTHVRDSREETAEKELKLWKCQLKRVSQSNGVSLLKCLKIKNRDKLKQGTSFKTVKLKKRQR